MMFELRPIRWTRVTPALRQLLSLGKEAAASSSSGSSSGSHSPGAGYCTKLLCPSRHRATDDCTAAIRPLCTGVRGPSATGWSVSLLNRPFFSVSLLANFLLTRSRSGQTRALVLNNFFSQKKYCHRLRVRGLSPCAR